jgi:hypothetical protein
VNRTQERAVAAMRAIGDTVTGAPPLPPLPRAGTFRARRRGAADGRTWRGWLVPAAAAVAMLAIAVSLVVVRSLVRGSAPATPAASAVPRYYVTLSRGIVGWYANDPGTASETPNAVIVGSTATGKRLATVPAPKGLTFNVVAGAADDRTFVVGAISSSAKEDRLGRPETWYLLRLSPGSAHVARLTRLPISRSLDLTGVALSPDGSTLAVSAVRLLGPPAIPATGWPQLAVLSLVPGKALLRQWSATSGEITTSAPTAKYVPEGLNEDALSSALRWSADGRQLAFAWNGKQIRLLDLGSAASRQPDLVKASTERATIGTRASSYTCNAAEGWQVSAGATTVTCAGSYTPPPFPGLGTGTGSGAAKDCGKTPVHPAIIQDTRLSDRDELSALAWSAGCIGSAMQDSGTGVGWASANGSTVVGQLGGDSIEYPARSVPSGQSSVEIGHHADQLGVFTREKSSKEKFSKLPALPDSENPADAAW